jgi:UDP-N-acetylglucosamine:LPS N-acetylglucosamine transferase
MEEKGAAVVVLEAECTEQRLMEEIQTMLADSERYGNMGKALQNIVIPDCADRLCDVIRRLALDKR